MLVIFLGILGLLASQVSSQLVGQLRPTEEYGYSIIVNILSLKIYKANPILLSKETNPEKINTLLKNYYSKNMLAYDICCIDNYL